MENKLPVAVGTKPPRFGTRNLEIASRRCPGTPRTTRNVLANFTVGAVSKNLGSTARCPGTRRSKFFFLFFSSLLLNIRELIFRNYRVFSVAWSMDGTLASGSADNSVKIWVMDSSNKFKLQSTLTGHSRQ